MALFAHVAVGLAVAASPLPHGAGWNRRKSYPTIGGLAVAFLHLSLTAGAAVDRSDFCQMLTAEGARSDVRTARAVGVQPGTVLRLPGLQQCRAAVKLA